MRLKKLAGTLHYNKNGTGYVVVNDGGTIKNITVMITSRNAVFDGDTVEIACPNDDNGRDFHFGGKILRVIKRKQNFVVGTVFVDSENKEHIKPIDYIPFRLKIKTSHIGKFAPGELVRAEVAFGTAISSFRAIPLKSYGKADEYESAVDALLDRTGYATGFSEEAAAQARELSQNPPVFDKAGRVCYTENIYAREKSNTKCSDTALSVKATENGVDIYIHTVDFDELIPEGSPIDVEASRVFRTILGASASRYSIVPLSLLKTCLNLLAEGEHPTVTLKISFDNNCEICGFSAEKSYVSGVKKVSEDEKYDSDLDAMRKISDSLRTKRIAAGGASDLALLSVYYTEKDESELPCVDSIEEMASEIFLAAEHCLANFYEQKNAKGLYVRADESEIEQMADVPLQYKPLAGFCSSRSSGAGEKPLRGYIVPCKRYSKETGMNIVTGYYGVCPMRHPGDRYEAVIQQRAIKAAIDGRHFEVGDVDDYTARNAKAISCDYGMRTLYACKEYSDKKIAEVVVLTDTVPVAVLTKTGVLGELEVDQSTFEKFSVGDKVKARVKSVSFETRVITFKI